MAAHIGISNNYSPIFQGFGELCRKDTIITLEQFVLHMNLGIYSKPDEVNKS